jgi:integrase
MNIPSSAMALAAAAAQLLAGAPAEHAIATLKQTYKTDSSLSSAMSRVRALILDRNEPPPDYDASELRALATPEITAFLALPLRDQHRVQREHRTRSSWGPDAEQALARLQILPKSLDAFTLTKEETLSLKRQREESLLTKNDHLITFDLPKMLGTCTAKLETAAPEQTFARLILPLLAVSGRRLGEIVNGRSTFAPMPHPHYTLFAGQLKKRSAQPPYVIPLLVPYETFAKGLRALRQKQGDAIANLTTAQATHRYQPNAQRAIESGELAGVPKSIHIHDLRSIYTAAVGELFVSPVAPPRMAMKILGHETLQDSLAYASAKAGNVGPSLRHSLGPLHA